MLFKQGISAKVFTIPFLCILISSLVAVQSLLAQQSTDSLVKPLLASQVKKVETGYIVRKSTIVYPEILKGNEEHTLDYIRQFSVKRRNYIVRMYTRGKRFLPKATTILKKYHLPKELTVLLPLESAYNGNAVSRAGAVGYWQIMDEVAKEYGIRYIAQRTTSEKKKLPGKKTINSSKKQQLTKLADDRKNFNVATHTAARYLHARRRNLDDNWLLVVASYNCGIGNVWNAMAKSGKSNPSFWDIKKWLPAETRAYVMNFITLNVIFNNYDQFVKNKLNFSTEKELLPIDAEGLPAVNAEDYTNL